LIQKFSSDHITKVMVTCKKKSSLVKLQWFDIKNVCTCIKTSL
jgi:hypothetical protein